VEEGLGDWDWAVALEFLLGPGAQVRSKQIPAKKQRKQKLEPVILQFLLPLAVARSPGSEQVLWEKQKITSLTSTAEMMVMMSVGRLILI
jgi:hypothetical protein